jgi:hypothetical protein
MEIIKLMVTTAMAVAMKTMIMLFWVWITKTSMGRKITNRISKKM